MKNVIVMSSGGFDSTYLIWKNLKEGNKVFPLYVSTGIGEKQKEKEIDSLNTICHYFSKEYSKQINCWPEKIEVNLYHSQKVSLQQPQVWVYGAYLFSQDGNTDYDEVQLGYIMNDDALSYLVEIEYLWRAFNLFQQNFKSNKIPEIKFPIIKMYKELLMDEASKNYPEIFHSIHFCESPMKDGSDCKECDSCKKAYNNGYEHFLVMAEENRKEKYSWEMKIMKESTFLKALQPVDVIDKQKRKRNGSKNIQK